MSSGICYVWYCKRPVYANGLCATHYQSTLRNGGMTVGRYNQTLVDLSSQLLDLSRGMAESVYDVDAQGQSVCPYCGTTDLHFDECPFRKAHDLLRKIDGKQF